MQRSTVVPGRVSVVMPAYQLAHTIAANIDRTVDALAGIDDLEIIVVDDGSDDGTRDCALQAAAAHDGVEVISYQGNRGKGAALQQGFAVATGDTVVFLDGDLDLPPEQVPAFVDTFRSADVDALVGAKQPAMAPGTYPPVRRVLSKLFSATVRVMFRLPVEETQTGLKVFRRKPLDDFFGELEVKRFTFDLELIVRMTRAGYSIAEAPVQLSRDASGTGVSAGMLLEMGRDTLGIWFRSLRW